MVTIRPSAIKILFFNLPLNEYQTKPKAAAINNKERMASIRNILSLSLTRASTKAGKFCLILSSLNEEKLKNIPGMMAKTKQIPPTKYIEYFNAFIISSFFLLPLLASLIASIAKRGNITCAIQRIKVTDRNLL